MGKNYTNEHILHVKDGNVEYIQFRKLNDYRDKLKHCVTLRHGGVSEGEYASLNFRLLGSDTKENVFSNIDIVCDKLDINSGSICKVMQAHTDNILVLNSENKEEYNVKNMSNEEYDAYIYNEEGITAFVTTADCNPIIIYSPKENVVANIHSGWMGTINKIYLKTLEKMINDFNCKAEDIIICVGPSINKCCFSSREDSFKEKFISVFENEEEYITYDEKDRDKFYIDLPYIIKRDFLKIGVKEENIVLSNICTKCNHEDFFSYRHARKSEYNDFGTMGTFVSL